MKVTILKENEIRECVGMNKEAVDAVALGFTRLVEGKVSLPPIIRVDVEANQGEVDIKTAYIEGLDHFAIKIASGFFGNPSIGLPYGSGMMVLMSAKTGFLEAILLDNGYLTDLRTGIIAGAIAAKHLAPGRIQPGVYPPEIALDPEPFFEELEQLEIFTRVTVSHML